MVVYHNIDMIAFNVLITLYSTEDPSNLICYIPYTGSVGNRVDEHDEETCNRCCAILS